MAHIKLVSLIICSTLLAGPRVLVAQEESAAQPEAAEASAAPPPPTKPKSTPIEPNATTAHKPATISDEVKELNWVGFQLLKDASRIFVHTNEPVRYNLTWRPKNKLLIELYNTKVLVRNHLRPMDTQYFNSPVMHIKPSVIDAVSPITRIELSMRQKVPYQVKQEDNRLYIVFVH